MENSVKKRFFVLPSDVRSELYIAIKELKQLEEKKFFAVISLRFFMFKINIIKDFLPHYELMKIYGLPKTD